MGKKLRYVLVGAGNCGAGKHLESYKKLVDDVEIAGVYDYNQALAKKVSDANGSIKVYETLGEVCADKSIDVVSVATANKFHASYAIELLNSGKHIHVEKPIAMSAEEAVLMDEAAKKAGKLLMVGLNNRFTETSQFAKGYIAEGHLGEVYHARCGWRRRECYVPLGSWFCNKDMSGGGPLIDLGVHYIDLTLFLCGYPAPRTVSAATYNKFIPISYNEDGSPYYNVEDMATGFMRFDNGMSVDFEFSWGSHIEKEIAFLEIMGSTGGIKIENDKLMIFALQNDKMVDIIPRVYNTGGWGNNEVKHFVECIKTGTKETLAPASDAIKMMKIIEATYKSAAEKCEVKIG